MRKLAAMAVCAALLFGATACSGYNDERGKGDAPVAGRHGDDTPAEVFNMPDGFGNVATKCVGHGFRVYTTTSTSKAPSNMVILADPAC